MSLILAHLYDSGLGWLRIRWWGHKHRFGCPNGHAWKQWYRNGPYPHCPECGKQPVSWGAGAHRFLKWWRGGLRGWAESRACDRYEKKIEKLTQKNDGLKRANRRLRWDSEDYTVILRAYDEHNSHMAGAGLEAKVEDICHQLAILSEQPVRATTNGGW